jgi:hypothetical protein
MSILVKITNTSDSFAIGTEKIEMQGVCPHCGHRAPPHESPATTIHPRDSDERIIKCGDKLVLTALFSNGLPSATY